MDGYEIVALELHDIVNLSVILIDIEEFLNWANCKDWLFS